MFHAMVRQEDIEHRRHKVQRRHSLALYRIDQPRRIAVRTGCGQHQTRSCC